MGKHRFLQLVGHHYPLYSGYLKVVSLPPFRMALRDLDTEWAVLRDGSKAQVRLDEPIGQAMYFLGDYDPKITWLLGKLLRPGDEVIDLGANVGVYALQMARIVGRSGAVHAIEPQSRLCDMLRLSAERNGYGSLQVHQVALTDRTGTVQLFTHPNSAVASLAELQGSTGHEQVRAVHAGHYLRSLTTSPRVLKIDVEGHEATVLGAAHEWLAEARPAAIIFESHAGGGEFFERPLIEILASHGYVFAQFPKARLRMHLVDVTSNADVGPGFDFVAVTPAMRAEFAALFQPSSVPAGA